MSWVNTTAASQGLFITGSFNPKSDYLQDTRLDVCESRHQKLELFEQIHLNLNIKIEKDASRKKKNLRQEQTCSYLKQLDHYSRTSRNDNLKKSTKRKRKSKNIYFVIVCITTHTGVKITESLDSEKL